MLFRKIYQTLLVSTVSVLSLGGGREAGRSLRQGQLPVYDFPLYLTESAPGRVWKIDKDHNKTLLAEGLTTHGGW